MTTKEHNEWAKTQKMSLWGGPPVIIPETMFSQIKKLGEYDKWKNCFIVDEKLKTSFE